MSKEKCGYCGKDPAEGFATINDIRYCHEGPDPTCYMEASWDLALGKCRVLPIGFEVTYIDKTDA